MRENMARTSKNATGNYNRVIPYDGGLSKMLRKEIHKELRTQIELSRKGYTAQ